MIKTEWICENGHEGVVEGGFAQKNAPEKCPVCGANVEENEIEAAQRGRQNTTHIIGQLLEKGNIRKTFDGSQEELDKELAQGWRKVSDDELANEEE